MDLEEQLQVLRQQYVGQLPKKFAEIAEHWRQLRAQDDATLRATLHRLTHSLAGSGATYGFPDISTAARRAENLFKIQPDAPDH
ncbi:MAG: Hpt domain-containing protein, partial [Gammaproteobacteria bacterium]|nr:Hpt domain-containing protein [Gammaproteobacteria bacterium]